MTAPKANLSRRYEVQAITQAADGRLHITLFEDNSVADATGAPMGANTLTFLMTTEEARNFFPGDKIVVTLDFA